jgi:uroporphyrinogen-III synthase
MGPASKRLRVIVTRAAEQIEPLAGRIEELGHEVVRCPLIELEPAGPTRSTSTATTGRSSPVRTERESLRAGARTMATRGRDRARNGGSAAGKRSRARARPAGLDPGGLLAELPRPAGRVLFAGAERARRLLVDELGADFVPLYRTRELRPQPPPDGDLVVLASSSARARSRRSEWRPPR